MNDPLIGFRALQTSRQIAHCSKPWSCRVTDKHTGPMPRENRTGDVSLQSLGSKESAPLSSGPWRRLQEIRDHPSLGDGRIREGFLTTLVPVRDAVVIEPK